MRTIELRNREGEIWRLEEVWKDEFVFTENVGAMGLTYDPLRKVITAFDPPGGPYTSVGTTFYDTEGTELVVRQIVLAEGELMVSVSSGKAAPPPATLAAGQQRLSIFTENERKQIVEMHGSLSRSRGDDESQDADDLEEDSTPTDSPFMRALYNLGCAFRRLGSMDSRQAFLARCRAALGAEQITRNAWQRAKEVLTLYAKALFYWGWVEEAWVRAVERTVAFSGNEEARNLTLFNIITSLPMGLRRPICLDIDKVASVLDRELFGMQSVKTEILHEIILTSHAHSTPTPAPIILHGIPGVGKSAIVRAIARALNAAFAKAGLGGNADIIFIRGCHSSWTSGAPGFFVRMLLETGCENPVVLLDEVDKCSGYAKGNVIDTISEVLDTSQNSRFEDLFLSLAGLYLDLSHVFFICSCNDLERVPPYVLDRCRVIHVPPYPLEERAIIIRKYLTREIQQQRQLPFAITVTADIASRIAASTGSLRVAKNILVTLVAQALSRRRPETVKRLVIKHWHSTASRYLQSGSSRQIGFAAPMPAKGSNSGKKVVRRRHKISPKTDQHTPKKVYLSSGDPEDPQNPQ
jgi:DNA polymerase III delta prime subunit